MTHTAEQNEGSALTLWDAAELQDHLLTASNDLDRLHTLLADACAVLTRSFHGATEHALALVAEGGTPAATARHLLDHLGPVVTALQFQDLACQLIDHTNRRLRACADEVARAAMGDDDADGTALVREPPPRPNPVTQDEMDAGSVELF